MPQNCSIDLANVIEYIDATLETGDSTAVSDLKAQFGLEDFEHNDEFAE